MTYRVPVYFLGKDEPMQMRIKLRITKQIHYQNKTFLPIKTECFTRFKPLHRNVEGSQCYLIYIDLPQNPQAL